MDNDKKKRTDKEKKEEEFLAFVASTAEFWGDIKRVESAAHSVVQREQASLSSSFLEIGDVINAQNQTPITRPMIERILDYATHLLTIRTGYPPDPTDNEKDEIELLTRWMGETAKVVEQERRPSAHLGTGAAGLAPADDHYAPSIRPTKGSDLNERRDEILMESLTAAWLALYFLGLPFSQIWERVRRMADDRGGYPSGACVTKFIGDIHRIARLEMARELKPEAAEFAAGASPDKYDGCQTLILSYMPFGMLKRLITLDADHLTPASVHRLGNCYMVLQMRLYIHGGFPIRYMVSRESLKQSWENLLNGRDSSGNANDEASMFDEIPGWIENVFTNQADHQSVQLLLDNKRIAGMATCVLGRQVGVYVLDTFKTSLPFAGNQLAGSLLLSYRAKLNNIDRGSKDDVIQLWPPMLAPGETQDKWMEHIKDTLHEILIKKPVAEHEAARPHPSVEQPSETGDSPSVREKGVRDPRGRGHDIPARASGADLA